MLAKVKKRGGAKAKGASGGGFGAPAAKGGAKARSPSAAGLLKQSMKVYDEIKKSKAIAQQEGDEDGSSASTPSHTEYCITIRLTEGSGEAAETFSDWVPIALLALKAGSGRPPIELVPSVLGACCREVYECGCDSFPVLRKASRASVQYAFEPIDSWTSIVYDGLQGRAERRHSAAAVLGVDSTATAGEIKKAHRKLMMELHPDRFVGDDEGATKANEKMLDVQDAYETLGGGLGSGLGSQYAAIGGKARVDFSGEISKADLGELGKERTAQSMAFDLGGWRAGVYPMDPAVTREFAARNLLATK